LSRDIIGIAKKTQVQVFRDFQFLFEYFDVGLLLILLIWYF